VLDGFRLWPIINAKMEKMNAYVQVENRNGTK
jgi:hypothetical protein